MNETLHSQEDGFVSPRSREDGFVSPRMHVCGHVRCGQLTGFCDTSYRTRASHQETHSLPPGAALSFPVPLLLGVFFGVIPRPALAAGGM